MASRSRSVSALSSPRAIARSRSSSGRILVDVTVLAPEESRGRELAAETLGDVVDALQAGGA